MALLAYDEGVKSIIADAIVISTQQHRAGRKIMVSMLFVKDTCSSIVNLF